MSRRPLILQLTPLLDLLLIVIFAQYMQVLDQEHSVTRRFEESQRDWEQRRQELETAQAELQSLRTLANAAESRATETAGQLEQTREDLERALAQQRVLGELMVELFQVPQSEIEKIFDPSRSPPGLRGPEELAKLRQRVQEFSLQKAGRMIEHLLSYDEIRKRCDVWELHVDAKGNVALTAGQERLNFLLETDAQGNVDVGRLTDRLYRWFRTLPESKSLVVMLLTYDFQSPRGFVQPVREALQRSLSRMQVESGGRIRFEYADLGFRLD